MQNKDFRHFPNSPAAKPPCAAVLTGSANLPSPTANKNGSLADITVQTDRENPGNPDNIPGIAPFNDADLTFADWE